MSSTKHRGALANASIGLAVLLPVCGILHACTSVAVEPEPYALDLSAIPNPMAVGDSVLLTATLYTKTLVVISSAQFVWESSNPSVATVDQQGWVRVKSMGETTISVTSNGFHASSALVTLGEVTGRVLVDGEPTAGFTVRLGLREPMYAVTDQLGSIASRMSVSIASSVVKATLPAATSLGSSNMTSSVTAFRTTTSGHPSSWERSPKLRVSQDSRFQNVRRPIPLSSWFSSTTIPFMTISIAQRLVDGQALFAA